MRIIFYYLDAKNLVVIRKHGRVPIRSKKSNNFSVFVRNCGEMASSGDDSEEKYQNAPTCASGSSIIYAWALDADKTELPKGSISFLKSEEKGNRFFSPDVAFKIGGSTSIKYLVLQVHYSNIDKFQSRSLSRKCNGYLIESLFC